jgi:hypothetical protein
MYRWGGRSAPIKIRNLCVGFLIEQINVTVFLDLRKPNARHERREGPRRDYPPPRSAPLPSSDREWWIPPQVWKSEICLGLDPTMVAKTLAERGVLRQARDGYQSVVKVAGKSTRVYLLQAGIIEGEHDAG